MDNKIIDEKDNGWSSWKIYVIKSLDNHQTSITKLEDNFHSCKEGQVEIKTKIGVWSVVISFFTSIIVTVIAGIILYSYTDHIHQHDDYNTEYITEELENK